ncbi:MAG: hypothetical protein ACOX5J_14270 [Candidatus Hydrogenedentales bacterium]
MSGRDSIKRRRTAKTALFTGLLILLAGALLSFRAVKEQLGQYPDGPPWVQRFLDARMARAVASQRISAQTLGIEIYPDTGRLQGHGTLDIECSGAGLDVVSFVLNPGLDSFSALCDGQKLPVSRWGGLVRAALPEQLAPGESTQIAISYSGEISATALTDAEIHLDEVWLPWTACWHPVDFGSFAEFDCTVTIMGDLVLAGDVQEAFPPIEGRRSYRIQPAGKTLGIPLLAGGYSNRAGDLEDLQCTVYFEPGDEAIAEPLAASLPKTEDALCALLGGHELPTYAIVSRRCSTPRYLGLNLIALPRTPQRDENAALAATATALAHKWWGQAVSPAWFPLFPDGGAWLLEGLAVHSGWSALRELNGKSALQEHLETVSLQPLEKPLRALSALELARSKPNAVMRIGNQGAFLARWLESGTGKDAYWAACRNVLHTHRGNVITLDAFRHALEIVSGHDLGEPFRACFDHTGLFDYAVEEVSSGDGAIRVTISNRGDRPSLQPLTIGVVTARGVDLHAIEAGGSGGTFSFPVDSPVSRVTLDPYFECPDAVRANNTWPRRDWPLSVAADSSGTIAVAQTHVWESQGAGSIRLLRNDRKSIESIRLPAPLTGPLLWSPGNSLLAFGAGQAYIRRHDGQIHVLTERSGNLPVGWLGEQLILRRDSAAEAGFAVSPPPYATTVPLAMPERPDPGTFVGEPAGGLCAFVSLAGGKVWVGNYPEKAFECVFEEGGAIGAPCITGQGAVRVFTRRGAVLEFAGFPGAWSRKTLLDLGRPVRKQRFSPDGSHVVWQEETGGRLTASPLESVAPAVVRLGESCVDFDWEDANTLVCLTRANEWQLPGRFHAVYTLQRVDMTTGLASAAARFPSS